MISYAIEFAIAIALIYFDLKLFFIYLFLWMLFYQYKNTNYLRKLIRVFNMANEVKIMAIIKKLGISKQDIQKVVDETKSKTSEKEWENLEGEIGEIMNNKH